MGVAPGLHQYFCCYWRNYSSSPYGSLNALSIYLVYSNIEIRKINTIELVSFYVRNTNSQHQNLCWMDHEQHNKNIVIVPVWTVARHSSNTIWKGRVWPDNFSFLTKPSNVSAHLSRNSSKGNYLIQPKNPHKFIWYLIIVIFSYKYE